MDELPLEIIFEGHSVSVKKFAGERNLFVERNDLFENCRCYSDAEKSNGVTFLCCGFSINIIWKDQFFIFDSHGRNTTGFHDTNGKVVLVKFSAISSVNNYIKTFYENNISFQTQYDQQYVSVEIMEASKNCILGKPRPKRKSSYNKSYKTKQFKAEAFALSKNHENQIYYQQNKSKHQDMRKQHYLKNKNDVDLIPEKNSYYYYDDIDFVRGHQKEYYMKKMTQYKRNEESAPRKILI